MRVAVDAMGGDHAPEEIVHGAVEAASEFGVRITLVGDERAIAKELSACPSTNLVAVHHCNEVIRMDEHPIKAVRQKKDASIRVAYNLVKTGEADALVSAGNSGATVAAGIMTLGRVKSIDRPAIAGIFPSEKGPVILIDAGANVDCRPTHLFQFGVMAYAFAHSCLNMEDPKIGLLSIGEEGSKGNEQVHLTRELFEKTQVNFAGNIEGRDVFSGDVNIIVCDGFVGNVVLKLAEGLAEAVIRLLKKELTSSLFGKAGLLLGSRSLESLRRKLDYEEYGGAPLLGINGVGIVCHGGSSARAIKNSIKLAARYANNRILEKMVLQLKALKTKKVLGLAHK
ncbi:MAG: phosphate acyltransferase PlsX [Desulfobacterales bacterium]|nr:phosphate acyltransferase PlsX [Desulfobacterales bacterium]